MEIIRKYRRNQYSKGQAIVEYAGLIFLITLVLVCIGMAGYLRNAIMGKMHQDMDSTFGVEQYDQGTSSTTLQRRVDHKVRVNYFGGL